MNRLAPLIVRRAPAYAMTALAPSRAQTVAQEQPSLSGELRLFATSFTAGIVFFGTYLA
jgi:hypothetical protein